MILLDIELEPNILSYKDLDLLSIVINKALEIKNDIELEEARDILNGYFKAFYSQFDYVVDINNYKRVK